MEPRDLRSFVERDWAAAGTSERDHWAREFAARGARSTLDAADALWRHMRTVRPDWPTDEDRQADLAHHIALKRAIDRAASSFVAAR